MNNINHSKQGESNNHFFTLAKSTNAILDSGTTSNCSKLLPLNNLAIKCYNILVSLLNNKSILSIYQIYLNYNASNKVNKWYSLLNLKINLLLVGQFYDSNYFTIFKKVKAYISCNNQWTYSF